MDIRYAVRVFAFKDNKVACIKYKNINKDYFDIPGGKIEDGETEIQTCIREFKEETGMDINDLKCIGNVEIIYPGKNKKFVMKTYIANKVNGNPLDLDDNYAYWLPINELTKNEKRFAITHLLDDDLINYFESEKINILFTCDDNHNITNIEALNEKHRLDIETKEKEHQLKIEEIKVQNEQEILKREKELSNSAMYSMMGDATKDLFAGIFNSPEFKEEMSKKIKEGFNKK